MQSSNSLPRRIFVIVLAIPLVLVLISGFRGELWAAETASSLYAEAVEAHWKWNLDKAIRLYTRVVALEPNHARAYFNRGVAYRSKQDFDRALADFEKALAIDPRIVDAL